MICDNLNRFLSQPPQFSYQSSSTVTFWRSAAYAESKHRQIDKEKTILFVPKRDEVIG
jgi:hypothetical protein